MKIEGTVDQDKIPESKRQTFGLWTGLAIQAIEAHEQGKALVVTFENRDEVKRAVGGMAEKLRVAGYGRDFVSTDNPDGSVKVFMRLREVNRRAPSVVVQPIARPRRRAAT